MTGTASAVKYHVSDVLQDQHPYNAEQSELLEQAAEAQTLARGGQPPTPASLVQRMRQIFDELKHPHIFDEQDPLKLRDRVDGTARQVHALVREGDHLPVQDREVVKQEADNILGVLDRISETVQPRILAMQTEQRPQQQQRQTVHDMEIARLLMKQLVAMLNVLKSDEFKHASARRCGAVAACMKQDLETVSFHLTRQPDVRQLLAPTRDWLLELLNAILERAAACEAQEQRQAGAGECHG
jgi:uncharacterized protein (DUF849 family)